MKKQALIKQKKLLEKARVEQKHVVAPVQQTQEPAEKEIAAEATPATVTVVSAVEEKPDRTLPVGILLLISTIPLIVVAIAMACGLSGHELDVPAYVGLTAALIVQFIPLPKWSKR